VPVDEQPGRDGEAGDELLDFGARRLPRRAVRGVAMALAIVAAGSGVVIASRPQVETGHGVVAAATAQRYHDEHTPRGNSIRGYFLI
jgi:hypothetical protein